MSRTQEQRSAPFHAAVILACSALSVPVCADCTLAGSGTSAAPYAVGTYADLEQVGGVCGLGATYRLAADIDASPSKLAKDGFAPIGQGSVSSGIYTPFTGAFHGAGHAIRNLFINDSTDEIVGFFGYVSGAEIDSLGLVDAEISGIVKGAVPSTTTGRPTMGSGDTAASQAVVGGVAGMTDAGTSIEVVMVAGAVTGAPAGAIVGTNGGNVGNALAVCRVAGQGYSGGIAGRNEGTVRTSYVAGSVAGLDSAHGGGIVGVNVGIVGNSYWSVPASGQTGASALEFGSTSAVAGLTADQVRDSANFAGFGFAADSAWSILQGRAAPALRAFAAVIAGIRAGKVSASAVRLRRWGRVTEIVLPFPAQVRVVDASGRQVLSSGELASGTHALDLPPSRCTLFVQVRSGISTTTLPLEPVR